MKIYPLLLLLAGLFTSLCTTAQTDPADVLAQRQALRMKDSLQLDSLQYRQVLTVNRWLYQRKQMARQQYRQMDSLSMAVQRVENKRDSLYQAILPDNKFRLYKQQKSTLISNQ